MSLAKPVAVSYAPRAVLLHGFHHDPVQLAAERMAELDGIGFPVGRDRRGRLAERADPRTGTCGLDFPDHATHFIESGFPQTISVERRRAGEQFVEQHPQASRCRCGVSTSRQFNSACSGLM